MILCTFIVAWGNFSVNNLINIFFTKLNWYLYAYFDFLLMLPFLRNIAQNTSENSARYYIVLVTVFNVISGLLIYSNMYSGFIDFAPIFNTQFGSLTWAIIFSLTGYFLIKYFIQLGSYVLPFFIISTIISLAMSVAFVISDFKFNGGSNVEQLRVHFIYAPACLLFLLIIKSYCKYDFFREKRINQLIIVLAGTTFGMFIIETHSNLINYINWRLSVNVLTYQIGSYKLGWISIFIQFLVCFIIVYLLRKIPLFKKML